MPAQPYHHGDLKAQLIREGLKLLNAEGHQGFSLRKVAQACGVSQTAPYRHFKNKDDLIAAITQQALVAFRDQLAGAIQQHPGDPGAQLKAMGAAYVRFFAANPEYLRLLFLSDNTLNMQFINEEAKKQQVDNFQFLETVTTAYTNAHPESSLSQNELLIYSWGLVHGIATLIVTGEMPAGDDMMQTVDKILSLLF